MARRTTEHTVREMTPTDGRKANSARGKPDKREKGTTDHNQNERRPRNQARTSNRRKGAGTHNGKDAKAT